MSDDDEGRGNVQLISSTSNWSPKEKEKNVDKKHSAICSRIAETPRTRFFKSFFGELKDDKRLEMIITLANNPDESLAPRSCDVDLHLRHPHVFPNTDDAG